jgi:hypothetical protein
MTLKAKAALAVVRDQQEAGQEALHCPKGSFREGNRAALADGAIAWPSNPLQSSWLPRPQTMYDRIVLGQNVGQRSGTRETLVTPLPRGWPAETKRPGPSAFRLTRGRPRTSRPPDRCGIEDVFNRPLATLQLMGLEGGGRSHLSRSKSRKLPPRLGIASAEAMAELPRQTQTDDTESDPEFRQNYAK